MDELVVYTTTQRAGYSIISDLHGMMSVMQGLRSGVGEPEALELRLFTVIRELAELDNLMRAISFQGMLHHVSSIVTIR